MVGETVPDLLGRFREHVANEGVFDPPGRALLAVSGGVDSIVLLDLMIAVAPALGLQLTVGHVHHGITAKSREVVGLVEALARRNGVPCIVESFHLGPGATETAARDHRYRALRSMQESVGATYLVTAHHADDQVETVLQRVLRGSGVAGLAGIPLRGADGLRRPLLPFRRSELEAWLEARRTAGEAWPEPFEDPENAELRHDRAWLRHTVLPVLRERLGGEVEDRLLEISEHARRENAAWSALLRALPELEFRAGEGLAEVAREVLARYDKLLCERILRAAAREAGLPFGTAWAPRLAEFVANGGSGRAMQLGGGWRAELAFDRVRLVSPQRARADDVPPGQVSWGEGRKGVVKWGDWSIRWSAGKAGSTERCSSSTWVTPGDGQVRAPEAGDRMVPLGGVGRRSVRRLLMEARVAASDRDRYPVVVRAGRILWIPGVCRSAAEVPEVGEAALHLEACASEHS